MRIPPPLAPGECLVLEILATDASYKEIARDLDRDPGTISSWATRAYRKLGVNTREAAVDRHRRLRDHVCYHLRLAAAATS